MILGFDIGNTDTVLAVFDRDRAPVPEGRFPTVRGATAADLSRTVDEILSRRHAPGCDVEGAIVSSVVGEVNASFMEMIRSRCSVDAVEVSPSCSLNIALRYDNPAQLGADRIVNSAAGFHEYGAPLFIVDLGTATTSCVVLEGGVFDGGTIGPGIGLSARALARDASQLLHVGIDKPPSLIATNTAHAIQSGLFYGWISMIEGLLGRVERLYGRRFSLVLTGGYSHVIGPHLDIPRTIDPDLTLKGLKLIYGMNRPYPL
jgi:type III pantothenate kinase